MPFDYKSAIDAGYSEDEVLDYLSSSRPDFDVKGALGSGYSLQEVSDHLSSQPAKEKEKGALEKGARVAGQYALGAIEGSVPGLVYDIGIAPAGSKGLATFNERIRIGEDIESLYEKNVGTPIDQWPEEDKKLYESLAEQIEPGGELKYVKPGPDLTIRGIAEKITGIDLKPEGFAEKAAQWTGFIKDPKKIFELGKTGFKVKDLLKAIAPDGEELIRGLGAGAGLQLAEEGEFGPIGTLAAAVVGDIGGNLAKGLTKGAAKIVTNPRQALAEVATKFTNKDKIDLQKQIINDFRSSGITADLGTLTNSDLVKWVQSRLAQSGLTGDALDELKTTITKQIKDEYKTIADSVGQSRFATAHEAGEVSKDFIKQIRDVDLKEVRQFYNAADNSLKKNAFVSPKGIAASIEKIEKSLRPGAIKSTEQNAVLDIIERLKRDIYDSSGNVMGANVKDLMNNKIALSDIVNYEVQGGQKQLLKSLISEIDRAIISHGKDNPTFAKNYVMANKRFSEHAKTFRNKRVANLLKDNDPKQLLNKMNTVQGIRDLDNMLKSSKMGQELMRDLKRFRLDKMIEDNFVDSTTQQIKLGTFSKLLEKDKNKEIIKELLPKAAYKDLKNLQKNAGRLAETTQKFLNTSKTGITLEDAGIVSKALWDLMNILSGNPWPLIRTGTGLVGARYLTKLMGDPTFLKLVEDMILASQKNNASQMEKIAKRLVPIIRKSMEEEKE
jgi:hypothetical protein